MPRHFPAFEQFAAARAEGAEVIPVYRQLLDDLLTPVSALAVLGRDGHAFLLESVVGGERVARHSFIATSPSEVFEVTGGMATRARMGHPNEQWETEDPLADLAAMLPPRRFHRDARLPAFTGGIVGYCSYDLARYYEADKLGGATGGPPDDRRLPDLHFGMYRELVVFDHVDKTVRVIANAEVGGDRDPAAAYADACHRVDLLVNRLRQPPASRVGDIDASGPLTLKYDGNLSRAAYEAAVEKGKQYIRAGDIFQFVPSVRLRVHSRADPLDVYRALRIVNPSPFMFYLKSPACTLIGSSPEIMCRVKDRVMTSRPLAGTRRRGATPEEDQRLEAELLADPKERAEHIMLVDLHRNDVGRVCQAGSVVVEDVMSVERYSHVMHITTNVSGRLRDDATAMDAMRVSLPVGTVSGAPKIRAMQIIDEVEPTRRGPYGGAVGYADFAGNMDTCIALRTIVHRPAVGTYDVQAGAGVVADSVASAEYDESMAKATALLKAVQLAEGGFQ